MKKSILNLEGVEQLSKNEKKSVNGGKAAIIKICECPPGYQDLSNGEACTIHRDRKVCLGLFDLNL